MNRVAKIIVAGGVAGVLAVSLSGCGLKADIDVSVVNQTVDDGSAQLYLSSGEVDKIKGLLTLASLNPETAELAQYASLLDGMQETTLDDGQVLLTNDNLKVPSALTDQLMEELLPATADQPADELGPVTADQLSQFGIIFDEDKLVVNGFDVDDEAAQDAANGQGMDLGMIGNLTGISSPDSFLDSISYYKLTTNFDKTPVASNGTIEGNTVFFDQDNIADTRYYVTFDEAVLKADSITSSVKDKALTKASTVTYSTRGIVDTIKVNGEQAGLSYIDPEEGTISANTIAFPKQGKNTVTVALMGENGASGYEQTFTYTHDSKKPTANVAKGKKYKKGKKVVVKDTYGLKSVKIDGKKVTISGKKATKTLKKAGKHKIVATDKAGNKLTVSFKIKK